MSAQPAESRPGRRPPEKTPAAIRSALLPEVRDDFDDEFRKAMAEATESFDLEPVHQLIEKWWPTAWLMSDPEDYQHLLEQIRKLEAGEYVHTTPWSEHRKQLGL